MSYPTQFTTDALVEDGPRRLAAYRWKSEGYQPVKLDAQERVAIPDVGLLLGLRDNRVVCFDAESGQEIAGYEGLEAAYEGLHAAYDEAQQRIRELEERLRRAEDK